MFREIHSSIAFNFPDTTDNNDCYWKIRPILEHFNHRSGKPIDSLHRVAIDEFLQKNYSRKTPHLQYMKSKPAK